MSQRATTTIILAVVLIIVVMAAGAALTFTRPRDARYTASVTWSQPFGGATSMKIMDLYGDGQRELFAQNANTVAVYDAAGKLISSQDFRQPLTTSLGDVNGDAVDDIIIAAPGDSGATEVTVISKGEQLWSAPAGNIGEPARLAVVRFAGDSQIVVGDDHGLLVALSPTGEELWRWEQGRGEPTRGLDDVLVDGKPFVIVASQDGSMTLLDEKGQRQWLFTYPSQLRRLRSYDLNGDGNSEILLGGEAGRLIILDSRTGRPALDQVQGQVLTEIREAELDGDPKSREILVGGKKGGVWALRADGRELWAGTVGNKVTELLTLAVANAKSPKVLVGDDGGGITLFDGATGDQTGLSGHGSSIGRIDSGRLTKGEQVAIADGQQIQVGTVASAEAPIWYTPLAAALLVSLVIAGAAWALASVPPKPVEKLAVEDKSPAGLEAERRMLHESIADVERLRQSGEMTPGAYQARLKDLRGQLAQVEVALQQAGVKIMPETMKCPNCGGTLPIGIDRCEYCGQVVIN
jgi:outer membrane protein assembly factor BamB